MRKLLIVILLCLLWICPSFAKAQSFKRVKSDSDLVLKQCALLENISRVSVPSGGRKLQIRIGKKFYEFGLGARYKFFACQLNTTNSQVEILAKQTATGAISTFAPTFAEFDEIENVLGSLCRSTRSLPGSLIYKTVGSHHFSDCRRNTMGIVAKYGFPGPFPSCANMYDTRGNKVGSFGLYQRGAGWAGRWYNCFGCAGGQNIDGGDAGRIAQSKSGSANVYLEFGGTCYGPIQANKCYGSKAC